MRKRQQLRKFHQILHYHKSHRFVSLEIQFSRNLNYFVEEKQMKKINKQECKILKHKHEQKMMQTNIQKQTNIRLQKQKKINDHSVFQLLLFRIEQQEKHKHDSKIYKHDSKTNKHIQKQTNIRYKSSVKQ